MYSHVVVIDDLVADSQITKKILLSTTFAQNVTVFNSAASAINYLSNVEVFPDLIFSDLSMPFLNGFAFALLYGQLPENKKGNCRLVMLTASVSVEELCNLQATPSISHVLSKPLTMEKLNDLKLLFAEN